MLLLYVQQAKVDYWNRKHELMNEKRKAEIYAHDATMTIMGLIVDLEAHIAHEIEWNHMEEQMVERQNELQESSRIAINGIVYDSMQRLGDLIESDMTGVEEPVKKKVHTVFEKQQHVMNAKMGAAFDEYTEQTKELNKVYLTQLQDEAQKNYFGLQAAHKLIKEFAGKSALANDNLPLDQLDAKLSNFFKNVEKKAKRAKSIRVPRNAVDKIEVLLHDFDKLSAVEIHKRITALLFPGGTNEGKPKYGVTKYDGGSIQAYLENILFLQDFKQQLYPALMDKKGRWESREMSSYELLDSILHIVEKGVLPATWLL